MPRWLRLLRGMLGTGLVFGGGMFVVTGILSLTLWLRGKADFELIADIMGMGSVAAFILGVGFSGVLAIAARGKGFDRISYRLVTGVGFLAGLLYFLMIAPQGMPGWDLGDALFNFALLTGIGSVGAAATLAVARKADALGRGRDPDALPRGDDA